MAEAPQTVDTADVPSYNPSGVLLYLSARIKIHAPASTTFAALTDAENYKSWNTFVPSAEVTPGPVHSDPSAPVSQLSKLREGDGLLFHVRMKPTNTSFNDTALRVSKVHEPTHPSSDDPFRVAWVGEGFPSFLLWADRTMEVIPLSEGECEFRTWETMGGQLARVVKFLYGSVLQDRFFDWARDLKGFAEA